MCNIEKIRSLILTISLLVLGGCSSYNTKFNCKPGQGTGCMPVHEINGLIDSGRLEEKLEQLSQEDKKRCKKRFCSSKSLSSAYSSLAYSHKDEEHSLTNPDLANSNVGNKTLRVWVASYLDMRGDYNEERYIQTQLE